MMCAASDEDIITTDRASCVVDSSRWDERIARAREMAGRHPDAADLLTFYGAIASLQRALGARWAATVARRPPAISLRASIDADALLDAVPEMLTCLERSAPPGLTAAIRTLRRFDASRWRTWLDESLTSGGSPSPEDAAPRLVIEALLQPMAEVLSAGPRPSDAARDVNRCPFCDCPPVVGVLREEGHGMKRTLLCGRCLREWAFLRVVCPACGERGFADLPVFTVEQIPGARIEACDRCHAYIKTIDLSKDGLAMPVVDDIATVALDLWARAQGYVRLQQNLLQM